MKKTLIRFALASGVLLMGCKDAEKQNDVSPLVSSTNARVENGRIVFNEDFYTTLLDSSNKDARKAVESLDKSSEFTSLNEFGNDAAARKNYRVSGTAAFSESELDNYPDFIKNILNPDGVVEIGDNIIRINLVKEKVYVLNKKHIDSYNDLLAENVSNKKILVFGTDQEVLNELKQVQNGRTDLLCFREGGAGESIDERTLSLGSRDRNYGRVQYVKLGIYFYLGSRLSYNHLYDLTGWMQEGTWPFQIRREVKFKPKCKNEQSYSMSTFGVGSTQGQLDVKDWESPTTALHKYYLKSYFKNNSGSNPQEFGPAIINRGY